MDGCDPCQRQVWDVKRRNLQESLADAGLLLQIFKESQESNRQPLT
jgi:hypothetical protein